MVSPTEPPVHGQGRKPTGGGTRLIANSSWNGVAFVVGALLNLLILPFVIAHIGIAGFGFAGLVVACVAPAMIFSTSLAQMTTRELAQHLSPCSHEEARRVFATSLFLSLALGAALVSLLILVGPWLAGLLFNLEPEQTDQLTLGFALGGTGWWCRCLAEVFYALFTARQDYACLARINIGANLAAILLMLLLIPMWPLATTFLACQAIGFAGGLGAAAWLARRSLPDWLALPAIHAAPLRRLARVGSWQIAAQTGGLLASQADRYLMGTFLHTRFIGYYNVSQRLEEAAYIGIYKLGEVLFPQFSAMQHESRARQAEILFRASWLMNLLAVAGLGGLIPFSGDILQLWTNTEVADAGRQVLIVLLLAGILGSGSNVFGFHLLAAGETRALALMALVTGTTILATATLVLPLFGWRAVGWGSLVGMVAQLSMAVWLMRRRFAGEPILGRILHLVLAPLGVGTFVALTLAAWQTDAGGWHAANWWQAVAGYATAALLAGAAVIMVASLGPHAGTCRADLLRILSHVRPWGRA